MGPIEVSLCVSCSAYCLVWDFLWNTCHCRTEVVSEVQPTWYTIHSVAFTCARLWLPLYQKGQERWAHLTVIDLCPLKFKIFSAPAVRSAESDRCSDFVESKSSATHNCFPGRRYFEFVTPLNAFTTRPYVAPRPVACGVLSVRTAHRLRNLRVVTMNYGVF